MYIWKWSKVFFLTILVFLCFTITTSAETNYSGVTIRVAGCKFPEVEAWLEGAQKIANQLDMKIEVVWYTFDSLVNKMVMDFRNGISSWDLLYVDGKDIPAFVKIGLLTPVSDLLKEEKLVSENLDMEDLLFTDLITSNGIWGPEGVLWGIPNAFGVISLAYRTDLFTDPAENQAFKDQFGYELRVPQTYKEFNDVAKFFTRKKGEMLAGEILNYDFYGTAHSNKPGSFMWHDYIPYPVAFGGDAVYNPDTMTPTWNSKENIEAAKFYLGLKPFMPPGAGDMTSGETCALFCDGKVAMIIEFTQRTIPMAENKETSRIIGKWDYTTTPSVAEVPNRKSPTLANTTIMGIYSLSENKEAAFKLVQEVASRDVMKEITLKYSLPPVRKSLLVDKDILEEQPMMKNLNKITSDEIYLFSDPMLAEFGEMEEITANSLAEVYAEQKSIEDSFNIAQEKLIEMFTKYGYIK
jgi:multiple sugar transport system substrate-binding protein